MEHLVPAIVVLLIVAFFMYKNINKITSNLDVAKDKSFEMFAKYSAIVEREIKDLVEEIEKNSVLEDEKYKLKDGVDIEDVKDKLLSLTRKLAFFETLQAKQKDKKELENEMFKILSSIDEIVEENFENYQELSDEIRENLKEEYIKLKGFYS